MNRTASATATVDRSGPQRTRLRAPDRVAGLRLAVLVALLAGTAGAQPVVEPAAKAPVGDPAAHDPIRFTRTLTVEGERIDVPMDLYLSVESPTVVLVSLAGDLTALQARLPDLLSRDDDGDCEMTTRVEVDRVTAQGREVRLAGRAEAHRYLCLGDTRLSEVLAQTGTVSVTLGGRVTEGCLRLRATDARIAPDGATGAIMDATGVTRRLTAKLRRQIDKSLAKGACLDLPEEFRAFDAVLTGGNLREIGSGGLGAVLHGRMTIDAAHFVDLIEVLAAKGKLGD